MTSSDSGAVGTVATTSASRYLQQLCKHWSHRFAVDFTPEAGRIEFGDGRTARLEASLETLVVRLTGAGEAGYDRFKQVVEEHLNRFAFREAPLLFVWRTPDP